MQSRWFYCVALSAALVGGRLIFFDGEMFLEKKYVPNHDMLCGFPFFALNMNSLRTTGDLAWWNPIAYNGVGYASYYQAFLSPMAPTPGHISFLGWAGGMRVLRLLGNTVPEYTQYVYFTYTFSPFLAFLSFTAFALLIFRSRLTVALVSIAYAYSGIGLWISAWFYFQEPCTLFLVLAALVAFLKRPTLPRFYFGLAAMVIQVASTNYWTIYNTFFYAIIVGAYAWSYPNQFKRAWCRLRMFARQRRLEFVTAITLTVVVSSLWLVLLASISQEQSERYVRPGRTHSKEEVMNRMRETRWMTTELFTPRVERPAGHLYFNAMHNARYIGIVFFPLLVLLPFITWGRRERWIAGTAIGVLCVCMAPPFLVGAWKGIPFMDRVMHVFYFYTHFWQMTVVLLAGCVLDTLLVRVHLSRVRLQWGTSAVFGGSILCLALAHLLTGRALGQTTDSEMIVRALLLLTLLSGLFYRLVSVPRSRYAMATLIVLISLADSSRYFYEINHEDHLFTRHILKRSQLIPSPIVGNPPAALKPLEFPMPEDVVQVLERPWPKPNRAAGFRGSLDHFFPVSTEFWPDNWFLFPTPLDEHHGDDPIWNEMFRAQPSLAFYPQAEFRDQDGAFSPTDHKSKLQLDGRPIDWGEAQPTATTAKFEGRVSSWDYNDFMLLVEAPTDGWVKLHLLHDPLWQVMLDGQPAEVWKANKVYMALPVTAGKHLIKLRYRPLARTLYPWACVLLLGSLTWFLVLAGKRRSQPRPESASVVTSGAITLEQRIASYTLQ